VVSIYIHEMGHVAEIKRLGIEASAPLFIPGIGALVRLRQHIDDPIVDARIGLAGPLWGLAAGTAAWLVAVFLDSHTWYAIARLTGYVNLFNLIPVWQLDGSRGFHALDRSARWTVVATAAGMFYLTNQPMLLVIGAVGAYRAFKPAEDRTDRTTLAKFVGLLVALSAMASIHVAV
jgi:Zn-dependent protease